MNMKQAIILHGMPDKEEYYEMDFPSPSNAHWIPWLQQKFLRADILCQTPEMPKPYAPDYQAWEEAFMPFSPPNGSVFVAHSAGCGFFLRYLAARPEIKLSKLVLVAPWLDPKREIGDFMNFTLDPALENRVGDLHVLHSDDDFESIGVSVKTILDIYKNARFHLFSGKGHFCMNDIGPTFPELWDICKD
jgi:predicted alpha/beta hydrolase family esterase